MTAPDPRHLEDDELRASRGPPAKETWSASRWPEATDVPTPVLYDKVDRRLMDTFPASDAVAQY